MTYTRCRERLSNFTEGFFMGLGAPAFIFGEPPHRPRPAHGSGRIRWKQVGTDVKTGVARDMGSPEALAEGVDHVSAKSEWNGALPPPDALEHFERVLPGSAERLIAMAEMEQAQRLKCDDAGIKDTTRGSWMGLAVAGTCIAAALTTAMLSSPWPVIVAFMSVPALGVVRVFIQGRQKVTPASARSDRRSRRAWRRT
jgi:uncharacterized membrane protein